MRLLSVFLYVFFIFTCLPSSENANESYISLPIDNLGNRTCSRKFFSEELNGVFMVEGMF